MSDIGAIEFGWWHDWHLAWNIGATSLVNVTCFGVSPARTGVAAMSIAPAARIPCVKHHLRPDMNSSYPNTPCIDSTPFPARELRTLHVSILRLPSEGAAIEIGIGRKKRLKNRRCSLSRTASTRRHKVGVQTNW